MTKQCHRGCQVVMDRGRQRCRSRTKTKWSQKALVGRLVERHWRWPQEVTKPHGGWGIMSAKRGDKPDCQDQGRQD